MKITALDCSPHYWFILSQTSWSGEVWGKSARDFNDRALSFNKPDKFPETYLTFLAWKNSSWWIRKLWDIEFLHDTKSFKHISLSWERQFKCHGHLLIILWKKVIPILEKRKMMIASLFFLYLPEHFQVGILGDCNFLVRAYLPTNP